MQKNTGPRRIGDDLFFNPIGSICRRIGDVERGNSTLERLGKGGAVPFLF